MQGHGGWPGIAPQHHPKYQVINPVQGMLSAIDIDFVHHFPAHKGRDKPGQTQDVIQMTVRQKYLVQPLKAGAGPQDLALGTFPTVNQEAIFFMLDYQ